MTGVQTCALPILLSIIKLDAVTWSKCVKMIIIIIIIIIIISLFVKRFMTK